MARQRWAVAVVSLTVWAVCGGCASLERVRQLEMANRNLEASKAEIEQELYDARTAQQTCRTQVDSLESQLTVKDQLVSNLKQENDSLEENFRRAQGVVEKLADAPVGPVTVSAGRLPPKLHAVLREFASRHPSTVTYDESSGSLKWSSDLLFAFASDVVKDSATNTLSEFTKIMESDAASAFDVIVVGHTDDVPISRSATREKHPTNRHLSVHRSISVAKVLERFGMSPERIAVMGWGEYRPVSPGDSDAARARNRRVEVYVTPHGMLSSGAVPLAAAEGERTPVASSTTK